MHTEHLNTPRLVADSVGAAVWRWDQQEPFGVNVPDENPSGLGAFEFPLRFPGQYADKETGLHYNYFRDYDPGVGRYVESDPIGLQGGLNTYAYVEENPLSLIDPQGLAWGGAQQGGYSPTSQPRRGFTCNPQKIACLTQCMLQNQTVCLPIGMGAGTIVGGMTAAVMACVQPQLAYPTYILVNAGVSTGATVLCNLQLRSRCADECDGGPTTACTAK